MLPKFQSSGTAQLSATKRSVERSHISHEFALAFAGTERSQPPPALPAESIRSLATQTPRNGTTKRNKPHQARPAAVAGGTARPSVSPFFCSYFVGAFTRASNFRIIWARNELYDYILTPGMFSAFVMCPGVKRIREHTIIFTSEPRFSNAFFRGLFNVFVTAADRAGANAIFNTCFGSPQVLKYSFRETAQILGHCSASRKSLHFAFADGRSACVTSASQGNTKRRQEGATAGKARGAKAAQERRESGAKAAKTVFAGPTATGTVCTCGTSTSRSSRSTTGTSTASTKEPGREEERLVLPTSRSRKEPKKNRAPFRGLLARLQRDSGELPWNLLVAHLKVLLLKKVERQMHVYKYIYIYINIHA